MLVGSVAYISLVILLSSYLQVSLPEQLPYLTPSTFA